MRFILKHVNLNTGVSASFWVVGGIDMVSRDSNQISFTLDGFKDQDGYLAGNTPLTNVGFSLQGVNNPMNDPIPDNVTTVKDVLAKSIYLKVLEQSGWEDAQYIENELQDKQRVAIKK